MLFRDVHKIDIYANETSYNIILSLGHQGGNEATEDAVRECRQRLRRGTSRPVIGRRLEGVKC